MPATPRSKLLPPHEPAGYVHRPRLESLLGEARERALTTIVAGAGYGKSTLLGRWAATNDAAWYTLDDGDAALPVLAAGIVEALRAKLPSLPADLSAAATGALGPAVDEGTRGEALAAFLAEVLHDVPLLLVLDDVHEIGDAPGPARMLDALAHQIPAGVHLVLASRRDPPVRRERLRGRGQVLELDGASLAFTRDEAAWFLVERLGEEAEAFADELHAATGGWPAAARLAVEALRAAPQEKRAAALRGLRDPSGALITYLAEEVFAREPDAVKDLVRRVAYIGSFDARMCEAIGIAGAADLLGDLVRRGLFLEHQPSEDAFRLHGLVREFVHHHLPLSDDEVSAQSLQLGRWLERNGMPARALRAFNDRCAFDESARLLEARGDELIASGELSPVLVAAEKMPDALRTPSIARVFGEACQVRGDWDAALSHYRAATGGREPADAGISWRMAMIRYLRGEIDEAIEVCARAQLDAAAPRDAAMLRSWWATAHWVRGDAARCRELAEDALRIAQDSGDQRALAAAHTVRAMLAALEGDRAANALHYERALDAAERARDTLAMIRIHTNRASAMTAEGRYPDALSELGIAIRLAEATGYASFLALALNNRAEVKQMRGLLDDAIADFEASKGIYQSIASNMVSYPLLGAADTYRQRGDLALARASYEEAIALAEPSGNAQALVPSLAGLARTLAFDDPEAARGLAERALALGEGMGLVRARLGAGWVALARGDRAAASELAGLAGEAARARRDRSGIAEALELAAMSDRDDERAPTMLDEALGIWTSLDAPVRAAWTALARAAIAPGRSRLDAARARLQSLGVSPRRRVAAGLPAFIPEEAPPPVAIQTLGAFRVLRGGEPVPATEWQSKKARDLLKILVARRGRPVPREFLMEALWPEEDPEKVARRLSVTLVTVRTVLDPERAHDADRYVQDGEASLLLDPEVVDVDVHRFLAAAEAGLAELRAGRADEGFPLLVTAESAYAGEFLEEDAYEDWAVALREEARAAYLAVARALAERAGRAGDHETAVRLRLRILERDPYDEEANLGLVGALAAAGRHGEARRCYRTYTARMEEIGVDAAPYPAPARKAAPAT